MNASRAAAVWYASRLCPPCWGRIPTASVLPRFLDQYDRAVKVIGTEAVGFGSDYDGASSMTTEGLQEVSKLPNLTRGLAERGYSQTVIRNIMGENVLRLFRAAQG